MSAITVKEFKEYLNSLGDDANDMILGFSKVNEKTENLSELISIDFIISHTIMKTEEGKSAILLLNGVHETEKATKIIEEYRKKNE